MRRLIILGVFLTLLTAIAEAKSEPYFSLSADRTFLPGEKIKIHLYANSVDALEFRVYKINDPTAFFENLNDVHGFGEYTQKEEIDKPTAIERFHDWKRSIWIDIREFFRGQFSIQSRAEIRETSGRARKSRVVSATVFAQVPILNSKQLVARWKQELPPRYFSQAQDVPLDSLKRGVYVVEATDGTLRAYTVVIISEMAVITKSAPAQLLVFTANRRSGAPVANAAVALWSDKKQISKLATDRNGLTQAVLPEGTYDQTRVIASHEEDVAIVAPYRFNLSSDPSRDWTGYIYTDRPVYRPGHNLHFKGILRARNGEKYRVPTGQVRVTIQDPEGKQVFQKHLAVSEFGTISGNYDVPQDGALGYYSISVSNSSGRAYGMSGGFHVEEYKKPEYEVKITPEKPRVLEGEKIAATIEARYYFGEPVAGAEVKYVVHTSTYWAPFLERDEDENSGNAEGADTEGGEEGAGYDYAGQQESEQSGKLDANGKLRISIPTRLDAHHSDLVYRIEARVTDEGRREIAGHNAVIATYGSFVIGVTPDSYLYRKNESIRAQIFAKDYDGKPVHTAVHVQLIRPKRSYPREQEEATLQAQDVTTDDHGNATVQFAAREAGSLIMRVSAKTPEGREVRADAWAWVQGDDQNESWWGDGARRQIQIVPDKKSYKPGETARLLIMTGVADAHVLVTTEGRTIQSKRIVEAKGQSVAVEVPVLTEHQPNFYVSAVFIKDNNLYQGSKNLKVPADQQKLSIAIEPSKPQFEPGEKASYTITAKDANGKPVAGDFSLGVVDEAIYAVEPENVGDIHQFFYGSLYDQVLTDSSLSFYFTGQAGKRPMILAEAAAKRSLTLGQLKPSEPLAQPKVRKAFPDTALWLADIKTDQSGRARAQLQFPDSLTTWRATVRGATTDTKVGSAVERVIVRKNLMVRLAVPRFFRQGDEVTISAIVHNYLPSAKDVQVSMDLKGLEVIDGATRQINVASKAESRMDWRVRAQNVREATIFTKALATGESDAMELSLPVIPFGVKLADTKADALTDSKQQVETTINLPGDPQQAAQTLDISVSPSIAGSIFGALDYLTSYPYGCTEQTMSSFLPNIVVAKAMKDFGLQSTVNTAELDKKIKAGLDRLYDYQHDDGGWGWWKEDESQVFMTAYVVSGLGQAKAAGYEVAQDRLERAEKYLRRTLDEHENMRSDLRAYVVYALAVNGVADSTMLNAAYKDRGDMSVQGLAMIALALHLANDQRASDIAGLIENKAVVDAREAHWDSNYDYFMEFETNDGAETTAYAVRALSLIRPQSPLLTKAAFWLVNHRDGGFFWLSTKQTAMVVFGLTEYLKTSHEFDADFNAQVYVNNKLVVTKHFTRADTLSSELPKIHLKTEDLQPGENVIKIAKSGEGKLYWSARGEYYSAEKRVFQNNRFSLNITRDYYRLAPEKIQDKNSGAEKIVYHLDPLGGEMQSGDVIAVRVTVGGGSKWRYLLIEDPIPAGAEFVQRDDLYEIKDRPDWWGFWYTRREFHDDHAAFFQSYFSGKQQYLYLLKIINPGKFKVSPASVQPMYEPSIISTTDAAYLEVR